ncbi:hypothetical protein GQ55_9G561300 [Panicum hallii var. hallii]|uniref:SprT-like domain-containing protein n=1 Tax=Panicum hallii var. hallii TaxID=1504633 RepID=A0A2T7CFP9_9POAL|nr:hypothetical protein GQ55_9G561300 [Panicum hallii var. hallii]
MVGSDPDRSGGAPDVSELFCHYNSLYFRDSLGSCAVSWAEDPLPDRDVSTCDYYPGGGGCIILLSKSLCECHDESDLKNVLLHEMIHAYICIKDNNNNHSDHGAKFRKLMNSINLSSVADPHRPVDGYSITLLHEIRKKYYHYKCQSCGDLIKSIKLRVPSGDDCIERKGVDDPCQNSKCHWHRHKQRCPGSYCRVQDSLPGGPKVEDALDEGKAEEAVCRSWHFTYTSDKGGRSNKNEREDASTEFLHVTDNTVGCSLDSSSRDRSNKKIKISKDDCCDHQIIETVHEAPKRPRTAVLENQEYSRRKKRKQRKVDGYSVIIEWLNYYCFSDSDEDEVPLINKRTERRRRQKLHDMSIARLSSNDVVSVSSPSDTVGSCLLDPGDNSKLEIVPASQPEKRSWQIHPVGSNLVAGNQAGHESLSSPLDSPIRGEIVDISDG